MRSGWWQATAGAVAAAALALLIGACGREVADRAEEKATPPAAAFAQVDLDPPAAADSLAPNLALLTDGLAATWLEPTADGHRLRMAALRGDAWSSPVTIAEGDSFFANWADLPGLVETGGGDLVAHWLEKTAPETYAYSIMLARSADGGATWSPAGALNDDATPTEHGFVSWLAEGDGARAFWLDGRAMVEGGAMTIRTAHVGEEVGSGEMLDEKTCECCSTSASSSAAGPLVVYRDRSDGEIRDIAVVRREGDRWSTPVTVHDDGWRIEGCPVNGPEIGARGESVGIAWFTAADSRPMVKAAFSDDGGRSFGAPVEIDAEGPIGRVDIALGERSGFWVSWIATAGDTGLLRLERLDAAGAPGPSLIVSEIGTARANGVPRLAVREGRWYLAWVETAAEAPDRIRVASGSVAADL